ncbi:MAG: DedA family protein [Phycisphaerales bacterium]|nr:DedA family protein [Phycisphaerales bacterium]
MGSGIATLPGMLNKSMLRPRRLLIYLAVLLVGLGIWWALSTWHAEANAFEQYVQEALKQYGPILLFLLLMASGVGVAIGEDIFIIPAGYLMEKGIMDPFWTIVAAYFGVIMADTLWLMVCKKLSKRILNIRWFRRFMHPRRILEIKHQFDQYGIWVIVISRFIPASRTTVITAAGIAQMSTWKFLLAETMSAIPTVICQLGIGYLAAKGTGTGPEARHVRDAIWIGMIVLLVLAALWWWYRSTHAAKRRPRAKMAWLLEATGRREPSVDH